MNFDLARIGEILQARRVERGLSLAQISDMLCLRKTLVGAIEAGDWGPLPHEVYVRGFIKKYASILHAYDEVAPLLETHVEEEKAVEVVEELPVKSPKIKASTRKFPRARAAYLVALAVLALGFFVYDRVEKDKAVASKTEVAQRVSDTATVQKETPAPSVRPVSEVSTVTEDKNSEQKSSLSAMSEPKRLMITCHERTWISAVIDGTEKKEFILSPHEIIVLNAKERFDLLVGNAGGIKLILNGKDTEFSGKSGEVKRVDLS